MLLSGSMWRRLWLAVQSASPIAAIVAIVFTFLGLALLPLIAPYSEPPEPPTRQVLARMVINADGWTSLTFTNLPVSELFNRWKRGQGWQVTVITNTGVSEGGWTPIPAGTNLQGSVRTVQLSWKTSMMISPTAKVNSEDLHHWRNLDDFLPRKPVKLQ